MIDHKPAVNRLFLREEALFQGIDLLFFAYRDFQRVTDAMLEARGLGRAHHRALHVISRFPGLTVGEALSLLKVKKQSLSRVLTALTDLGLVAQAPDPADRRRKILTLTQAGRDLVADLSAELVRQLAAAYRQCGAEAVEGYRRVLMGLIDAPDRVRLQAAFAAQDAADAPRPGSDPTRIQRV